MNYRNAKKLSNGWIDCEIEHEIFGWIPFTCDPNDTAAQFNTAMLHAAMEADPETAPYIPPTQAEIDAEVASVVRQQRDGLLFMQVDPIVSNPLRWADLSAETQQAWIEYRRALLDITIHDGFPHNIDWPQKPEDI